MNIPIAMSQQSELFAALDGINRHFKENSNGEWASGVAKQLGQFLVTISHF